MFNQIKSLFFCLKILALVYGVFAIHTAQAARLALVVGNDSYAHVSKLQNARNDAKLMASTLKDAGFDVTYAEDADRTALWRVIETLGKRINKGDEVVFFFAGHGVQIGTNPVLLPIDIKAESDRQVERDGVPLFDVQDSLKAAKVSLLIIDACRDNPFPKVGTRHVGSTRGLVPPDTAEGQAIILSAGRNQKALDTTPGVSTQHGLFTHEFVKIIKENGLDMRTALIRVRDSVDDKAKSANHEQRPSVIDDLRGNFYFFAPVTIVVQAPVSAPIVEKPTPSTRPVTRVQGADEIEQQAWEDVQNMDSKPAYELYLTEYPTGRFAARAKIKLAAMKANTAPVTAATVAPAMATTIPTTTAPTAVNHAASKPITLAPDNLQTNNLDPFAKAKRLPGDVNIKVYLNTLAELSVAQIQAVDRFQKIISEYPYSSAFAIRTDGNSQVSAGSAYRMGSPYMAQLMAIQRCNERVLKSPCSVIFKNGKFDKAAFEELFTSTFDARMPNPKGLVAGFISIMERFQPH
jgi:Caspase domain